MLTGETCKALMDLYGAISVGLGVVLGCCLSLVVVLYLNRK